mgnify:CR=1 FL=1
MLGFTLRQDFEGDQFTFFKPKAADLEALYGLEILELALYEDLETGARLQVSSSYAQREYKDKMAAHLEAIRTKAVSNGIDYFLCDTSKPLDASLRKYLAIRTGRM